MGEAGNSVPCSEGWAGRRRLPALLIKRKGKCKDKAES